MQQNNHLERYFRKLFKKYGPLKVEYNINKDQINHPGYYSYMGKETMLFLKDVGMIITDGDKYIRIRDFGFEITDELTTNYWGKLIDSNKDLTKNEWEQQHKDPDYCFVRPLSVSNPQIDERDLERTTSDIMDRYIYDIEDHKLTAEQKDKIIPYLHRKHKWEFVHRETLPGTNKRYNETGVILDRKNPRQILFYHDSPEDPDGYITCHIYSSITLDPSTKLCEFCRTIENDEVLLNFLNNLSDKDDYISQVKALKL